jgi:hypothetical protein
MDILDVEILNHRAAKVDPGMLAARKQEPVRRLEIDTMADFLKFIEERLTNKCQVI